MRRILLLLLAGLLFALPAAAKGGSEWWLGGGGGGSSGERFDACRGGTPGGGYDSTTGTYQWTCANYNFAKILDSTLANAAYAVTCTAAGAPDASCLRSGEQRLINVLHTAGSAADYTVDGGTVYWPLFSGKDHGIYVDRGCGVKSDATRNNCPAAPMLDLKAEFSAANWALRGPHTRRHVIQAMRGITHLAEAPGTVDVDAAGLPTLRGVWYIADRGQPPDNDPATGTDIEDGPSQNIDPYRSGIVIGGQEGVPWCDDTSATNPRCLLTTDPSGFSARPQAAPSYFAYGVEPVVLSIDLSGAPSLCVDNDVAGDTETTTTGTCPGDRFTRCWATGAETLRSSGGCCWDLNASGDCNDGDYDVTGASTTGAGDGPGCQGFVDALAADLAAGVENTLAMTRANCTEPITAAADCTYNSGAHMEYIGIQGTGAACSGDGKLVVMGSPGSAFMNPLPPNYQLQASDTVRVARSSAYSYRDAWEGIGIMPSDWYGRTGRCTVGNEAACDTAVAISPQATSAIASISKTLFYRISHNGLQSSIDGGAANRLTLFDQNRVLDPRIGPIMDTGSHWRVRNNWFHGGGNASSIATAGDDLEFTDNWVENFAGGAFLTMGVLGPAKSLLIRGNVFSTHGTGGASLIHVGTVSGGTIDHNIFSGNRDGPPLVLSMQRGVGSTSTKTYARDILITGNRFEQTNNGAAVANTVRAHIAIFPSLSDSATTSLRELSNVVISGNSFEHPTADACGVYIEDDRQAAYLTDETRPQVRIEGNRSYGTTPITLCMGSSAAAHQTRATTWPATGTIPRFLPMLTGNLVNGVNDFEYPWHQVDANTVPDCGVLTKGYEVTINDDITAIGTCAHTTGVFTGGGTFVSTCICNPAASGVWTAK